MRGDTWSESNRGEGDMKRGDMWRKREEETSAERAGDGREI